MRSSPLYFIAAALFFVAAALGVYNDGSALKSAAGVAIGCALLVMGIQMRRQGK